MMLARFSQTILAATILYVAVSTAHADSRSDWKGYDWRAVKRSECQALGTAGSCQFFHGKWDWKRNQWVDLVLNYTGSALEVVNILTNYDRADDDYVCTVVLFQDAEKQNVAAFHFNEHSDHQTAANFTKRFEIARSALDAVTQISVGTKQCREGGNQDKGTYARVLDAMSRS